MSRKASEHHSKAAEHHESASRHHKEAAKHHDAGNHERPPITLKWPTAIINTPRITAQKQPRPHRRTRQKAAEIR
jgi:hypothetical protein